LKRLDIDVEMLSELAELSEMLPELFEMLPELFKKEHPQTATTRTARASAR